jgi:hypothetical protein
MNNKNKKIKESIKIKLIKLSMKPHYLKHFNSTQDKTLNKFYLELSKNERKNLLAKEKNKLKKFREIKY